MYYVISLAHLYPVGRYFSETTNHIFQSLFTLIKEFPLLTNFERENEMYFIILNHYHDDTNNNIIKMNILS